MIEAILALVGVVVGVVGNVVSAGAQKFAQRNAEYEAAIQFQRDKETSLFSTYNAQQLTVMMVLVAGIIGLIVMVIFLNK